MGGGDCGAPALVDVKDGTITRIRPLHYDMSYDPADFNVWKLEAKGKTLKPPMRPPLGPISLAYKNRVYSPNRVLYPMKRVGLGPHGSATRRTAEGRLRAHLVGRGRRARRRRDEARRSTPTASPKRSSPSPTGTERRKCSSTPPTAATDRILDLLGDYTLAAPQRRQLGRMVLGKQHVWGCEPSAQRSSATSIPDVAKNTDISFLGLRPGDDSLGVRRAAPQPHVLLVHRDRHQVRLRLPRPQLRRRGPRRQMDAGPAQHRCRPVAGHRPHLADRRHIRQGVCRDPLRRLRHVPGLRARQRGRGAQDPCLGGGEQRCPLDDQSAGPALGEADTSISIGNGGPDPRTLRDRAGPPAVHLLAMQGLGKPGRHLVKMIEWNLHLATFPLPYQGKAVPQLATTGESAPRGKRT